MDFRQAMAKAGGKLGYLPHTGPKRMSRHKYGVLKAWPKWKSLRKIRGAAKMMRELGIDEATMKRMHEECEQVELSQRLAVLARESLDRGQLGKLCEKRLGLREARVRRWSLGRKEADAGGRPPEE